MALRSTGGGIPLQLHPGTKLASPREPDANRESQHDPAPYAGLGQINHKVAHAPTAGNLKPTVSMETDAKANKQNIPIKQKEDWSSTSPPFKFTASQPDKTPP